MKKVLENIKKVRILISSGIKSQWSLISDLLEELWSETHRVNEIILTQARYGDLRQTINTGQIDFETESHHLDKIKYTILDLLSDIEKDIKLNESNYNSNRPNPIETFNLLQGVWLSYRYQLNLTDNKKLEISSNNEVVRSTIIFEPLSEKENIVTCYWLDSKFKGESTIRKNFIYVVLKEVSKEEELQRQITIIIDRSSLYENKTNIVKSIAITYHILQDRSLLVSIPVLLVKTFNDDPNQDLYNSLYHEAISWEETPLDIQNRLLEDRRFISITPSNEPDSLEKIRKDFIFQKQILDEKLLEISKMGNTINEKEIEIIKKRKEKYLIIAILGTFIIYCLILICAKSRYFDSPIKLQMIINTHEKNYIIQEEARMFIDTLYALSKHRIQIDIDSSKLASAPQTSYYLSLINSDSMDILITVPYYLFNSDDRNDRISSFFCAVPFGMATDEFENWMNLRGMKFYNEYIHKKLNRNNVTPYIFGCTGQQSGGFFTVKINSIEDFKKIKYFRVFGLGEKLFEKLAGQNSEKINKLAFDKDDIENHVLNGQNIFFEYINPAIDDKCGYFTKMDELQKRNIVKNYFYYINGYQEPTAAFNLFFNTKKLQEIKKDDEYLYYLIEDLIQLFNIRITQRFQNEGLRKLDELRKNGGQNINVFDLEILYELKRQAVVMYKSQMMGDALADSIYNSYSDFHRLHTGIDLKEENHNDSIAIERMFYEPFLYKK